MSESKPPLEDFNQSKSTSDTQSKWTESLTPSLKTAIQYTLEDPSSPPIFPQIPPGFRVGGGRFQVLQELNRGAFGAVYETVDTGSGRPCAVKAQSLYSKRMAHMMRMERAVVERMVNSRHVVMFLGSGGLRMEQETEEGEVEQMNISWVAMGLVGENLRSLSKRCLGRRMGTATVMQIGKQGIQALEDLHKIGYIHRDVTPYNLAVGTTPATDKTIYIFDFGLARKILDKDNHLKPPRRRKISRLIGHSWYCSMNAHKQKELGRQDDLIGLTYMIGELRSEQLPWERIKRTPNDREITRRKLMTPTARIFKDCPREIRGMFRYLSSLTYYDEPDYGMLKRWMEKGLERRGYSEETPYDWMPGGRSYSHIYR